MEKMLVSSIFQLGSCCCQHVRQLPLLICSPSTAAAAALNSCRADLQYFTAICKQGSACSVRLLPPLLNQPVLQNQTPPAVHHLGVAP